MSPALADPTALARDLLRCPSVTPAEAGTFGLIEGALKGAGFTVHRVTFAEPGTAPVENLYARVGTASPHFAFAGHVDVVPPGEQAKWTHPPFAGEIADGTLYGRGAVDMKGAIACALAAVLDHLGACGGRPMSALMAAPLDHGSAQFDASNLEFTSIDIGNPVVNLIPGEARARFNIRFNDRHSQTSLKMLIEKRAGEAAAGRIRWRIDWEPSNADSFVTKPGPFVDLVSAAIKDLTGKEPKLSTSGGTSDARFIKDYCPVLEFGLVGQTMHQVDERTTIADLATLTAIYRKVLDRYFG